MPSTSGRGCLPARGRPGFVVRARRSGLRPVQSALAGRRCARDTDGAGAEEGEGAYAAAPRCAALAEALRLSPAHAARSRSGGLHSPAAAPPPLRHFHHSGEKRVSPWFPAVGAPSCCADSSGLLIVLCGVCACVRQLVGCGRARCVGVSLTSDPAWGGLLLHVVFRLLLLRVSGWTRAGASRSEHGAVGRAAVRHLCGGAGCGGAGSSFTMSEPCNAQPSQSNRSPSAASITQRPWTIDWAVCSSCMGGSKIISRSCRTPRASTCSTVAFTRSRMPCFCHRASRRGRDQRREGAAVVPPHLTEHQVREYRNAGKCFGCRASVKGHYSNACPKRKVDGNGNVSWSKIDSLTWRRHTRTRHLHVSSAPIRRASSSPI